MGNEQTHSAEETILGKETQQEVSTDINAEQTKSEESGPAPGQEKSEQVDFAQMYDMLTSRDKTINELKTEIAELKKTNTNLLLKVNASATSGGEMKDPFQNFIDAMVKR